jgi:hypothetical protein
MRRREIRVLQRLQVSFARNWANANNLTLHFRTRRQHQPVVDVEGIDSVRVHGRTGVHAHIVVNLDLNQGAAFQGSGIGIGLGLEWEVKTDANGDR